MCLYHVYLDTCHNHLACQDVDLMLGYCYPTISVCHLRQDDLSALLKVIFFLKINLQNYGSNCQT